MGPDGREDREKLWVFGRGETTIEYIVWQRNYFQLTKGLAKTPRK